MEDIIGPIHIKKSSKYRNRKRLERASQEQSNGTNKTPYDRVKQSRERKRMNADERINDGASTPAAGTVEIMQVDDEITSILTPDCVGIDCTIVVYEDTLGSR
ncbi:uncharacterized protein TNCT_226981 [Trichonephila clavata]|uniref:Uncharacterized protein n=1 Tax=Trichonephila clavata TaxID=2740835 RepID=A0A8X6HKZ2_TRICU|nr:uncharacterized protein TNCT_226981 [Trichonephila clavata]